MGFGHRVYKNYDPRAQDHQGGRGHDPRAAGRPRRAARHRDASSSRSPSRDDYFVSHKLYPNVDFYSGLIYHALGFPIAMFTVLFAIGRVPGWIAHWREMMRDPGSRIGRPRQLYVGARERDYVPMAER